MCLCMVGSATRVKPLESSEASGVYKRRVDAGHAGDRSVSSTGTTPLDYSTPRDSVVGSVVGLYKLHSVDP